MSNAETMAMVPATGAFDIPDSVEDLYGALGDLPTTEQTFDMKPNLQLSQEGGVFTFGLSDREPVEPTDQFIVDVRSFVKGARLWKQDIKDKNIGPVAVLVPVNAPNPTIPDASSVLGEGEKSRDGWKEASGFTCRGISGSAAGHELEYITDAKMANSAVAKLRGEVIKRATAGETALYPVIRLGAELVKTNFGKKYKPIFKIVGYMSPQQIKALGSGEQTAKEPDVIDVEAKVVEEPARERRRRN